MRKICHTIKGTSETITAKKITFLAKEIGEAIKGGNNEKAQGLVQDLISSMHDFTALIAEEYSG